MIDQAESPPMSPTLEIIVVPRPRMLVTEQGDIDEDGAAVYLSHRMRTRVAPRTLRDWRARKVGPVFHQAPGVRHVWYRVPDLDEWLATCAIDPIEAAA